MRRQSAYRSTTIHGSIAKQLNRKIELTTETQSKGIRKPDRKGCDHDTLNSPSAEDDYRDGDKSEPPGYSGLNWPSAPTVKAAPASPAIAPQANVAAVLIHSTATPFKSRLRDRVRRP